MGESEAGYDAMIQWIQARIELPGYASEQWLGEHNTSPLTGLPLASTELAPNAQLLTQIASFLAAHPHLRPA